MRALPILLFATAALAPTAFADDRPAIPLGLDTLLPAPGDNPITAAKVALGRNLFYDKRLSRNQVLSCASCHEPGMAFADAKPLAVGVAGRKGPRRTPRILNRAYGKSFFWDGRATTLEQQVGEPIANPLEMNFSVAEAAARVELTEAALRQALATYVRTILAGGSPYDHYLAGDNEALSAEARAGLTIFRGKGGCVVCHLGPNLTDEQYHNTGVGERDPGREKVTGLAQDRGKFKTPSLREVATAPPYMHDGSIGSLEEVIEHYNRGGGQNPNLDPALHPLNLTPSEKAALVALLRSFSGTIREGPLDGL